MTKSSLFIGLLLIGAASTIGRPSTCRKDGQRPGYYSRRGIILCFQDIDSQKRHLEIPSPDGSIILTVDGNEGTFKLNGKQIGQSFSVPVDAEIIWSPDSQFIINTMSLGGLGPVTAGISYVVPGRPEIPDVTIPIQKDFAAHHSGSPCTKKVNVGGLTWEKDSRTAVLLAEVPASSACGSLMGYFEAYEVSVPEGKILARHDNRETIKRWRKVLTPQMLEK